MLNYFAYGSNMLPQQMAERCPGSRARGKAVLRGWRFHITTRGSASIVPIPDGQVHGALWRCSARHFNTLDRYEGVALGNYRRHRIEVIDEFGHILPAITYVGARRHPGRARVNYMVTAVLAGADAFGLPEPYVLELMGWLPRVPVGEKRVRYRGSRKWRRR